MIQTSCNNCGKTFKLANEMAGRRGKCPKCRAIVSIPEQDEAEIDFDALSALIPESPVPTRNRPVYKSPSTRHTEAKRNQTSAGKRLREPTPPKRLISRVLIVLIASPIIALLIVRVAHPPGRSAKEDSGTVVTSRTELNDVADDFERYARSSMDERARSSEQGYNAAQDWIAKRPEGTTISSNWRSTYVSSSASKLAGDPTYDAIGTLIWELNKPDGTEQRSDDFRRKRVDGRWEQVFKGVTPRPTIDFTTAHQSFKKFAPAFLESVVTALNADSTYRVYLQGVRTSDAWFEVFDAGSGPEAKLCFDVKGDYALVDAKLMFVIALRLDGDQWKFANGRWGYETTWQEIASKSAFITAANDANNPFNRMSNTATVQDRTRR